MKTKQQPGDAAQQISQQNPHRWRWHATGAGMGWVCDGPCGAYFRFVADEVKPPQFGCEPKKQEGGAE